MTPADHYAEAEKLVDLIVEACLPGKIDVQAQASIMAMGILANIHATLATVDRAVSRQAEVSEQAKRAMCTCAHIPDIPAAVTHVDPDCPIHGGS